MQRKEAVLNVIRTVLAVAATAAMVATCVHAARAADARAELYARVVKQAHGKKVAWVPVRMGVLESEWIG